VTRHTTIRPFYHCLAAAALAALTLASGCIPTARDVEPVADPEGYEEAYEDRSLFDDLEFYGRWHWVEPFGWVWRPTVVLEWRPFINGRWLFTEFGWTWISYEPFGWATCYYGSWAHDFALGWIWIPDYEWYPARVNWIVLDDAVCWSPIPFEGYYWEEPWERGDVDAWVVVPIERFTDSVVGRYHTRIRFRSRHALVRHEPDPQGVSYHLRIPVEPVQIELSQSNTPIVRQIVLPPVLQLEVDEQANEREQAYRELLRDADTDDPEPDDEVVEPEPRDPAPKMKKKEDHDDGSDDGDDGDGDDNGGSDNGGSDGDEDDV